MKQLAQLTLGLIATFTIVFLAAFFSTNQLKQTENSNSIQKVSESYF